jgi:hypothetical protein
MKLNEGITFLLELVLLAVIPIGIVSAVDTLTWKIAGAVLADIVLAAAWSVWLAPRSPRRLPVVPGLILATVLLAVPPTILFLIHEYIWAVVVGAIFVVNRIVAITTRQW